MIIKLFCKIRIFKAAKEGIKVNKNVDEICEYLASNAVVFLNQTTKVGTETSGFDYLLVL